MEEDESYQSVTSTVREFECEFLLSSKGFSIQKVWGNRFLHYTAQDSLLTVVTVSYCLYCIPAFCVRILDH